jgi:hypothetical protein
LRGIKACLILSVSELIKTHMNITEIKQYLDDPIKFGFSEENKEDCKVIDPTKPVEKKKALQGTVITF